MSQYPNPQQPPYPQPPTGYPPLAYATGQAPVDPMAPARRASTLMFVLGGIATLMGLCMGAFAFLPMEQLAAQGGRQLPPLPAGMTWSVVAGVFAVISLFAGVSQLLIAGFVRRATRTPILLGIIVASLILIYFVINTASGLIHNQPGAGILGLVVLSIYALQIYLLIQALRAVPYLKQMHAAYQAQYWQYVQQQQAYQNSNPMAAGSSYNQTAFNAPPAVPTRQAQNQTGWQWPAPPPPPPLSPPSPASQNPENTGGTYGQDPQQ